MPSIITFFHTYVFLSTFLAATTPTTALPSKPTSPLPPNLTILIRNPDNSFSPCRNATHHLIRSATTSFNTTLSNRGSTSAVTVQSCLTTFCTDCRTVFTGNFTVNSACIEAVNSACLIISNARDAEVEVWGKVECAGTGTVVSVCGVEGVEKGVAGTESLGVRVGGC